MTMDNQWSCVEGLVPEYSPCHTRKINWCYEIIAKRRINHVNPSEASGLGCCNRGVRESAGAGTEEVSLSSMLVNRVRRMQGWITSSNRNDDIHDGVERYVSIQVRRERS